jgi:hypothetical protein
MKSRTVFLAGGMVGYVLGARAGRARYEQIAAMARRIANMPPVQHATEAAANQATQLADSAKQAMGEKVSAAVAESRQKLADKFGDKVPARFRNDGGAAEYDMPSANGHPVD